jgi:ankyrin repeat protein
MTNLCLQFGATAIIFASMCGQINICKMLISHGADVNLKNNVSLEWPPDTAVKSLIN